jgi:multimeric flavodoxin WrbA
MEYELKILAISGSPRKGNTYHILQKIEKELSNDTDVEFKYIFLKDANFKTCIGCFQCIQKGSEFCPLEDDKVMILDEMLCSDGVILATPAYNYNVSSIMKNFIDRFAFIGHRPQFFNQNLMIVTTTGGTGLSNVKKYFAKYVGKLWGFRSITKLGIVTGPYQKSNKQVCRDDLNISRVTLQFKNRMQLKIWKPKFYHIDQFCTARALWSIPEMENGLPNDYKYYNSLWKQRFYLNMNINFIFYALAYIKAKLLVAIIKVVLRN